MISTNRHKEGPAPASSLDPPQEMTLRDLRINNSPFAKLAFVTMGKKRNGCQTTAPNKSNNNILTSTSKRVESFVLPDIPVVSNLDDWLTTFSAAPLVTNMNTDTTSLQCISDTMLLVANSGDSQARNAGLLETHSVPPSAPLGCPSRLPDLPNFDPDIHMMKLKTDPQTLATSYEVSAITVANANTATRNQKSSPNVGFSFNTTPTLSMSSIHRENPNCKVLSKSCWLSRLKHSIYPSPLARQIGIGTRYNKVDKGMSVDQKRRQKQGDNTGNANLPQTYHPYTSTTVGATRKDEPKLLNGYPLVARCYRRSVYNAALSDFSPLVSPDGSVLHDSTLYRHYGSSSDFNDNAMVTRIFQEQVMTPSSMGKLHLRTQMDHASLDHEIMEPVLLGNNHGVDQASVYINQMNWNNSSKRVSKALLDNMEEKTATEDWCSQDEKALTEIPILKPEPHEQQMDPTLNQTKQQRRLSQRLRDAFKLSANNQSTRAIVVQPTMAASSFSSSITRRSISDQHYLHNHNSPLSGYSNHIDSWRSHHPHHYRRSDIHQLNSLRKTLYEIASLTGHELNERDRGQQ